MGDACCADDDTGVEAKEPQRFIDITEVRAAAVSGTLLVAGVVASDGIGIVLLLAALAVGGSTFVPDTLRALRRGRLGVGTLMTVAAAGAVALGEYGEAASLAFLFSISEALEGYALARTRRGLRALLALVPEKVSVRRDAGEVEVAPEELMPGDVMIVGPGGRVATDGTVVARTVVAGPVSHHR